MARRRPPRIVPTLVMSASFATAIPTCTLLADVGCGSSGPDVCRGACGDVADVAFAPDRWFGGDVAMAFDGPSDDVELDAAANDAAADAGDEATDDAPDGRD